MAEAERIIGTPDTPESAGAEPGRSDDDARAAESREQAGEPAQEQRSEQERPDDQDPGPGQDGDQDQDQDQDQAGEQAAEAPPRGRRKIGILFAVAAFAYALDLISKMIVVAKLEHHEPINVIGDLLRFEAIRNAGAAFGIGEAFTVIFTVIAAAVIVVIVRLARKLYSLPWAIALGLLLGGALGNLTDRIFRAPGVFEGAVVDFIAPKGFAVFNLADSAIVCGGILIVLLSFRGLDPDGTVHKD
ncbi:signal peptidase II [Streptomyces sp. NPDC002851]